MSTDERAARLQAHRLGRGPEFSQTAREQEITFTAASPWPGSRTLEQRLKSSLLLLECTLWAQRGPRR
jgi:hypothetical protein